MSHISLFNLRTGSNTEKATPYLNFNSLGARDPRSQSTGFSYFVTLKVTTACSEFTVGPRPIPLYQIQSAKNIF